MAKNGYISLNREIQNHWLFQEKRVFSKFEAWIYLLMDVNHTLGKVPIGNQIVEVKRGQTLTSILKLSEIFSWSRFKVKSFLTLLENDGMIEVKTTSKYTLLTIVKYDFYQGEGGRKQHQNNIKQTSKQQQPDINPTSIQHQTNTNNKNNNNNNENKNNNTTTDSPEFAKLFQKFESKINPSRAISIIDYLSQDIDRYGYEIVDYAFDETIKRHKTNYGYAQSIMNRCETENIKTRAQAEQRSANKTQLKASKEMTPEWVNKEYTEEQKTPEEEAELEAERREVQRMLNNLWEE